MRRGVKAYGGDGGGVRIESEVNCEKLREVKGMYRKSAGSGEKKEKK